MGGNSQFDPDSYPMKTWQDHCRQVQKQTKFLLGFESIKNTSPCGTRLWSNYKINARKY